MLPVYFLHDIQGKVFVAWIVERIQQYGFFENQDYILTVSKTGKRLNVSQKDYYFHENALEDLKNAQVIMPAREFLKIKQGMSEA